MTDKRALAQLIERELTALANRGDADGLTAAIAIHAALSTKEGRRAAGLQPRLRGREFDPDDAIIGTDAFAAVVALVSGNVTEKKCMDLIRVRVGTMATDDRTLRRYIAGIKPRAEAWLRFIKNTK